LVAVKKLQGFAALSKERRREIASMGGKAVPKEKRSYSTNHKLAVESGRKGGANIDPSLRSFSTNNKLAVEAAKKGQAAYRRNALAKIKV